MKHSEDKSGAVADRTLRPCGAPAANVSRGQQGNRQEPDRLSCQSGQVDWREMVGFFSSPLVTLFSVLGFVALSSGAGGLKATMEELVVFSLAIVG